MLFIEISVDQYQVCELEENSNCVINDIQYVSAVQVFDPFTVKVSFTEEAQQERRLRFISLYMHSP